jgi:hypothetical protein
MQVLYLRHCEPWRGKEWHPFLFSMCGEDVSLRGDQGKIFPMLELMLAGASKSEILALDAFLRLRGESDGREHSSGTGYQPASYQR